MCEIEGSREHRGQGIGQAAQGPEEGRQGGKKEGRNGVSAMQTSELAGLFEEFYSKFVLRDLFGKIIPGGVFILTRISQMNP